MLEIFDYEINLCYGFSGSYRLLAEVYLYFRSTYHCSFCFIAINLNQNDDVLYK